MNTRKNRSKFAKAAKAPEQLYKTADESTIVVSDVSNDLLREMAWLMDAAAQGLSEQALLPWAQRLIAALNLANEKKSNMEEAIHNYLLPTHPDKWVENLPRMVSAGYTTEIFQLLMQGVDFVKVLPEKSNERKFFGTVKLLSNIADNAEPAQWSKLLIGAFKVANSISPACKEILFNYINNPTRQGWAHKIAFLVFINGIDEVRELIGLGVKCSKIVSDYFDGGTPLHVVKNMEMFDLLVSKNSEAIFTKNNKDLLPVHCYAMSKKLELVKKSVQLSFDSRGQQGKLEMLFVSKASFGPEPAKESLLGFLAFQYNNLVSDVRAGWLEFFIECCEFIISNKVDGRSQAAINAEVDKTCGYIRDAGSKKQLAKRITAKRLEVNGMLAAKATSVVPGSEAISLEYRQQLKAFTEWDGDVEEAVVDWAKRFAQILDAASADQISTRNILLKHIVTDGPERWAERLQLLVAGRHIEEIYQLLLRGVTFSPLEKLPLLEKKLFVQIGLLSSMKAENASGRWADILLRAFALAQDIAPQLADILFRYIYNSGDDGWAYKMILLVNDADKPSGCNIEKMQQLIALGVDFSKISSAELNGATPLHMVVDKECLALLLGQSSDDLLVQNSCGQFPVHSCLRLNNSSLIKMFIGAAAQASPVLLNTMLTHKVAGKTLRDMVFEKREVANQLRQSSLTLMWGLLLRHIDRAELAVGNVEAKVKPAIIEHDDVDSSLASTSAGSSVGSKDEEKEKGLAAEQTPSSRKRKPKKKKCKSPAVFHDVNGEPVSTEDCSLGHNGEVGQVVSESVDAIADEYVKVIEKGGTDSESKISEDDVQEAQALQESSPNWSSYIQFVADNGLLNKKGKLNLSKEHLQLFAYHHEQGHSLLHCAIAVDDSVADYKEREEGYQGRPGYQALQLIAQRYPGLLLPKVGEVYGHMPPLHYACRASKPEAVEVLLNVIVASKQADLVMKAVLGALDGRGMTAKDYAKTLPNSESKKIIIKFLDDAAQLCEQAAWSDAASKKAAHDDKPVANGKAKIASGRQNGHPSNGSSMTGSRHHARNKDKKLLGNESTNGGRVKMANNPNITWVTRKVSGAKQSGAVSYPGSK